jgi:type II secretory pathway component PulJ
VQRIRRAAQELQQLRYRNDAMSLDRKRSALAAVTEALWDDLARDLDDRPL